MADVDKGQQAINEGVFLMEDMVFKAGYLDKEFIVFHKAFQELHELSMVLILIVFHAFLNFIEHAADAGLPVAVLGIKELVDLLESMVEQLKNS